MTPPNALDALTGYELAGCADRAQVIVRVLRWGGEGRMPIGVIPIAADWERFAKEIRTVGSGVPLKAGSSTTPGEKRDREMNVLAGDARPQEEKPPDPNPDALAALKAEVRREVIEECAKVAEIADDETKDQLGEVHFRCGKLIAKALRSRAAPPAVTQRTEAAEIRREEAQWWADEQVEKDGELSASGAIRLAEIDAAAKDRPRTSSIAMNKMKPTELMAHEIDADAQTGRNVGPRSMK